MRAILRICLFIAVGSLLSCSPVHLPVKNKFQISTFSEQTYPSRGKKKSILVTSPSTLSNLDTDAMYYIKKPYTLTAFVHNEWASPPADMLYPLIVQSLQKSRFFYAVASSPYAVNADYRLDTQLLTLHQDFIKKPSVLVLKVKIVLTRVSDNKVLATALFAKQIACPQDTPYGGVRAANKATFQLTRDITSFVVKQLRH